MNKTYKNAMMTKVLRPVLLGLAVSLAAPALQAAEESLIDTLNQLIAEGRFQEAYLAAQPGLLDNEGDPEFDFLYGLAAMESGRPDLAVFALERVVLAFPDQPRVKLELARANYMSNNLAESEQLFLEILDTDPEPNVQANIRAFLDIIDERQNAVESSFSWFVTSGIGNDSNINSATELGIISTPIGDIELSPSGRSISDSFMDYGAGLTYNHPFTKNSGLVVNSSVNRHNNLGSSQFDLDSIVLDGGYARVRENNRFNHSLRLQRILLGGRGFQQSASLVNTWQRQLGNNWSSNLVGAMTAIRFDNTALSPNNSLRDVNQVLVAAGINKASGNFLHGINTYLANESALRDIGANNAQRFYGISYTQQYLWRPGHIPFVRLSMQKSHNKSGDPVFVIRRADDLLSATAGWLWQPTRQLNVTADATYTDNSSNIPLFSWDRFRYQASLRYQF